MSKKKFFKFLFLTLIGTLLISACAPAAVEEAAIERRTGG